MRRMNRVNKELREYIERNIFTQYELNNVGGHGIDYIKTVIQRCFEIIEEFGLDLNKDIDKLLIF